MAVSTRRSVVARNAAADAICALLNAGKIRLYTTSQPATPETAVGGTLLVEWTLPNPAFGAASAGVATANPISNAVAGASGNAGWFRVLKSDGTTAIFDGTVGATGTGSFNLVLASVAITSGLSYPIASFTYTEPMQGA